MRTILISSLVVCVACTAPRDAEQAPSRYGRIATVEAFRAARAAGDTEAAGELMAPDARLWFGAREGAGRPWDLDAGGPWAVWDEHFGGHSEPDGPWEVELEGRAVSAVMVEHNDYYRLTESAPGRWRGTYYLDEVGRIEGFLVARIPGVERDPGRTAEFEAWAREHDPDEAAYLMPGGEIDPSGDRPARMRALLERWRAAVGLPPPEPRPTMPA